MFMFFQDENYKAWGTYLQSKNKIYKFDNFVNSPSL